MILLFCLCFSEEDPNPSSKGISRIVCVVFGSSWHPLAAHVLREVEKFRRPSESFSSSSKASSSLTPAFKFPIFVIDLDSSDGSSHCSAASPGPVIQFYYSGSPILFRRSGWADDEKFIGSPSKENLTELFQCARAAENTGNRIIQIDF
jgi:hypothetical protein